MKQGYWVVRTYLSGRVGEKIKYWVEGEKPTRSRRKMKQDIRKRQQNEAAAEKRMARLLNANFTAGDILLGLDYSDEGLVRLVERFPELPEEEPEEVTEERELFRKAAEKELRLCIRRVQRALGDKLKYIAVTSDMDGKTEQEVRVHHHLVIQAEALPLFQEKWSLGGVHFERLSGQADYTPVAVYLCRQVRFVPDAKKYMPSRNLIRPEPKDRIARNGSEIRVPKGAVVLQRAEYVPGRPQYLRYLTEAEGVDSTRAAQGCAWESAWEEHGKRRRGKGQDRRDADAEPEKAEDQGNE